MSDTTPIGVWLKAALAGLDTDPLVYSYGRDAEGLGRVLVRNAGGAGATKDHTRLVWATGSNAAIVVNEGVNSLHEFDPKLSGEVSDMRRGRPGPARNGGALRLTSYLVNEAANGFGRVDVTLGVDMGALHCSIFRMDKDGVPLLEHSLSCEALSFTGETLESWLGHANETVSVLYNKMGRQGTHVAASMGAFKALASEYGYNLLAGLIANRLLGRNDAVGVNGRLVSNSMPGVGLLSF
ncbi:MAG: hypothetical protein RJQ08_11675 [Salinisphaeraceae bacterium]